MTVPASVQSLRNSSLPYPIVEDVKYIIVPAWVSLLGSDDAGRVLMSFTRVTCPKIKIGTKKIRVKVILTLFITRLF